MLAHTIVCTSMHGYDGAAPAAGRHQQDAGSHSDHVEQRLLRWVRGHVCATEGMDTTHLVFMENVLCCRVGQLRTVICTLEHEHGCRGTGNTQGAVKMHRK
eukprot:1160766-Pelagomonas_calceolata.AAC.20